MRGKMAGVFIVGFSLGALFVTLLLWRSGTLSTAPVLAGERNPLPSAPPLLPPNPPVEIPPPAVPPPPEEKFRRPVPGPEGDSEHLAMPIAGVDPRKLEDSFNANREGRRHEALDIMAPRGTPVLAVAEGNVVKLFTSKPGGLTVYQFNNAGTYCYYYAHLDRYAAGLKEGTLLRKGALCGQQAGTRQEVVARHPHRPPAATALTGVH